MMSESDQAPLLRVADVSKVFYGRRRSLGAPRQALQAVAGVSLELKAGSTVALVGESGCGKSTVARMIVRLLKPTSGTIEYEGVDIGGAGREKLTRIRQQLQMVFQDPYSSLNPRWRVKDIVSEPLGAKGKRRDRAKRARELLDLVGLPAEYASAKPGQLSGGQRQRVGIARALALEPKVVILDEPVSALDVSVQAQVLNLLVDLQARLGLSYLFISHDLPLVNYLADEVIVMYMGQVVERGTTNQIMEGCVHPYTRFLLSAVPVIDFDGEARSSRILLDGELPSPTNPPSGCRFRTRCWKASEVCSLAEPRLADRGLGHHFACHFPEEPGQTSAPRS